MTESTVVIVALLIFGWAVLSRPLAGHNLGGPLIFAVGGYLLCNPNWGPWPIDVDAASVHVVAEVTLALVLFSDAARVNVHELRRDLSLPVRLLAIGLPLSVLLGWLLAGRLLPDLPWGLAGFLGAALAPTDAALSVQVINDDRIPLRLRRALNVESGLNDGIATPIVTVFLAVAASQLGVVSGSASFEAGTALRELGVGLLVGLGAGIGGAVLLSFAGRRQWIVGGGRRLATLALALGAFTLALAADGNGFIAAFAAGIAFGATFHDDAASIDKADEFTELGGELLALWVWFLFGAALVPIALEEIGVGVVAYALVSLTIVRMLPVAVCLFHSGLDRPSVGFIAWFGPRGLASVVFALLAVEELGESSPATKQAVGAVALTVALSVLLHGITAGPGGRRYVQQAQTAAHDPGQAPRARPTYSLRPPTPKATHPT